MNVVRLVAPVLFVLVFAGGLDGPGMAQMSSSAASSLTLPAWQVTAGSKLAFEVATVKPNTSNDEPAVNFTLGPGDVYAKTGGRFLTSSVTLLDYIRFAYKLTHGQVEIMRASAPGWVATERFDIQAKSALPDPTKDQTRLMVQSLLADRFHLAVHQETRDLPVLALVLAKPGELGPQLRPHPPADTTCSSVLERTDQQSGTSAAVDIPNIVKVCGGLVSVGVPSAPSHVGIGGRKVSLELVAAHLGEMGHYDRPIVDQTGLTGTFDLVLEWGPDAAPNPTAPPDREDEQALLQEALKDQLGLKLVRTKASTTVLLLDHLDREPAPN